MKSVVTKGVLAAIFAPFAFMILIKVNEGLMLTLWP